MPETTGEMILKVRIPETEPMARLRYEDDEVYPGWYVSYPVAGLSQRVPLTTWNLNDVQGAIAEAAALLCISSTEIQCDSD